MRQEFQEATKQFQENLNAAHQTLESLDQAVAGCDALASKDLPGRVAEVEALKEQKAKLMEEEIRGGGGTAARIAEGSEKEQLMEMLAQMSSIRVTSVEGHSVVHLELLGLDQPYSMRVEFDRVGMRPLLKGASITPATVGIIDIVEYCISINDPAFLISQTLIRARNHRARSLEVAEIAKRHLAYDDISTNRLRITFPSGVIAALESSPDYPSVISSTAVKLVALDTMGVANDSLAQTQAALVGSTQTLSEAVEALARKFTATGTTTMKKKTSK